MYPILYDTNKIYFNLGKGKLVDCLSCIVSEEINGDYSLEFTYPVTGPFFDELLAGGTVSVVCPHIRYLSQTFQSMRAAEWFDIYKHSVPINGVVTFYAQHVSRRLAKVVYSKGTIGGGNTVSTVLSNAHPSISGGYDGLYFYATKVNGPNTYAVDVGVQSCLSTLIGGSDSYVSNFGGEFIWSCDSIYSTTATPPLTLRGYYTTQRGADRGVEIRHGYNLTDINSTSDKIGVFNAVVPYWEDGNGNRTFVTGYVVQPTTPLSPIKAVPLDATSAFSSQPTEAQLTTFAQNWLDDNAPWNGEETLEVDFVNGAEIDPHGADIALGDTVHVYWKDGQVDTQLRVVSYKYDVLAERYSELRLGSPQTQFVAVTGDSYAGQATRLNFNGVAPVAGFNNAIYKIHYTTPANGGTDFHNLITDLGIAANSVVIVLGTLVLNSTNNVVYQIGENGNTFCFLQNDGTPYVRIHVGDSAYASMPCDVFVLVLEPTS